MIKKHFSQTVEIKFWDTAITLLESKGPILAVKNWFYGIIHTKPGFLTLMILLWSAIGFVAGLLIGRIISLFPLS
jgi:hypothetical protein